MLNTKQKSALSRVIRLCLTKDCSRSCYEGQQRKVIGSDHSGNVWIEEMDRCEKTVMKFLKIV